jgi:hypothetical protein
VKSHGYIDRGLNGIIFDGAKETAHLPATGLWHGLSMSKGIQPHEVTAEWMDLKRLSEYACASEKTLRSWIHSATHPLPASQRGTKLYVRRRDFDDWMSRHQVRTKAVEIDRIVEDIVSSVMGA